MAADVAKVARALNQVESAGEVRAAIDAAYGEVERVNLLVANLSAFSTPDPGEGYATVNLHRAQLNGERAIYAPQADDSPIDPPTWARTRRAIEGAYIDMSGIEATQTAVGAVDVSGILLDAVENAPKVLGSAVGSVLGEAGKAAGRAGGGLLAGLGLWGFALAAVVVVIVLLRWRVL